MADIRRRDEKPGGLSLDCTVNAAIAKKQQREDADRNYNPADWDMTAEKASSHGASENSMYQAEAGNVPDESQLFEAMDAVMAEVTSNAASEQIVPVENPQPNVFQVTPTEDVPVVESSVPVHSGFPKSLAEKQSTVIPTGNESDAGGFVVPAPVVDQAQQKQKMQRQVEALAEMTVQDELPVDQIRNARHLYLDTHADVVEQNDGSLCHGQKSSVKGLPKAMLLLMMQEFQMQPKNQSDAVIAWVICHAPAKMAEQLAPFLTNEQMALVEGWQGTPTGSVEQKMQALDRQTKVLRQSVDMANMMISYLVAQGLNSPGQSRDIEFLQDSTVDIWSRAENQVKSGVLQKQYRNGPPKRNREN